MEGEQFPLILMPNKIFFLWQSCGRTPKCVWPSIPTHLFSNKLKLCADECPPLPPSDPRGAVVGRSPIPAGQQDYTCPAASPAPAAPFNWRRLLGHYGRCRHVPVPSPACDTCLPWRHDTCRLWRHGAIPSDPHCTGLTSVCPLFPAMALQTWSGWSATSQTEVLINKSIDCSIIAVSALNIFTFLWCQFAIVFIESCYFKNTSTDQPLLFYWGRTLCTVALSAAVPPKVWWSGVAMSVYEIQWQGMSFTDIMDCLLFKRFFFHNSRPRRCILTKVVKNVSKSYHSLANMASW